MKFRIATLATLLAVLGLTALAAAKPASDDNALQRARTFVEQSDRYLHHSKLKRGMSGYGLSVMAGTEIVKFDAKVVSVVTNWGPHQDVILAQLSGQGLEDTKIIAGMSGSPVYIRDPEDGKHKMIGAVAYGWSAQNEPLTGIQPITQMLAMSGVLEDSETAGDRPRPVRVRGGGGAVSGELLAQALDPTKRDFVGQFAGKLLGQPRGTSSGPQLKPVTTPLMVSGASAQAVDELDEILSGTAIRPMQGGGAGPALVDEPEKVKLEPGAAVCVPLATGDADYYAIGTVTDVLGDRVLAFGHPYFGTGEAELPMATGYVHTVVSGLVESFKLGSTLQVQGVMDRDEAVGIGGRLGRRVEMIPMTVKVNFQHGDRWQVFNYKVARHPALTPLLVRFLLMDAASGWHDLPEHHVVRHDVDIDYGELGHFKSNNVSSDRGLSGPVSDAGRAVLLMTINPFAEPTYPEKIEATITIEQGQIEAAIEDARLDGQVYRPGDTVTGQITLQPFREDRMTMPVRFELPDDLPDGTYQVVFQDYQQAVRSRQQATPQRFDPRTAKGLLEAVRSVTATDASRLYIRLPRTDSGGLAVDQRELPDLPASKLQVLKTAANGTTRTWSGAFETSIPTDRVLSGSASVTIEIKDRPDQLLLRDGQAKTNQ
ncbi:MAG: hypothetical protein ACOC93_00480 [Planctomycetota bacterium]